MTQDNVERSFNIPSLPRLRQARNADTDRVDGIWNSLDNDEFHALQGYVKAYAGVLVAGYRSTADVGGFDACQRTLNALEDLLARMNHSQALRAIAERVAAGDADAVTRSEVEQAWSAAVADLPADEGLLRLARSLKLRFDAWTRSDGDEALDELVHFSVVPRGQDTELAFSGGGTRAAALSLGVLLYLVDAGQLAHVRQIASVSGGSITNAFVANSITAAGGNVLGETALRDFAGRLSGAGLPLERLGRLVGKLGAAALAGIVVAIMLLVVAALGFHPRDLAQAALAMLGLTAYLGWLAYFAFRLATESLVGAWFAYITNATRVTLPPIGGLDLLRRSRLGRKLFDAPGLQRCRLGDLKSPFTHVFSATDLRHGEHFHLSQQWTASNTFGTTDPGDIWLDEAVRASAAFPGALPPVKLKLDRLRLAPDKTAGQRHLELVDGGVRDNLGHTFQTRLLPERSAEREALSGYRKARLHIVVDASAPRGVADMSENFLARVPMLRKIEQIVTFPRVIGIMNQSNSEARALALWHQFGVDGDGIVVQVRDTPVDACRRAIGDASIASDLLAGRGAPARVACERQRRAEDALRALARVDAAAEARWNGLRNLNQSIATTLDGLGEAQVAGLLRHGYVLAMCLAHIEFGWPLCRDDQWSTTRFERMAAGSP